MLPFLICMCLAVEQTRPLAELIEAERAFARLSEERSTQEAFLSVLADDAVLFRPQAVNGLEHQRANPAPPDLLLRWRPMLALVSQSGDLGYTSGPFESGRRGQPVRGKGYFVSVWQRTGAAWRLQMDVGITSPQALPVSVADSILKAAPVPASAAPEIVGTEASLLQADRDFARLAGTRSLRAAFEQNLAADVRLYRNTQEPAQGKTAALALIGSAAQTETWTPTRARTARSGELGYTWGTYQGAGQGNYLRIWRLRDSRWIIVLDITSPVT